ncbi:MAG: M20/M25/M40 family metallo-hydrolase [Synergistaceae bacterium]|nr:M20/M25/M40 family metallo-hydrolase [Synergistaceae bacterium]
MKKEQLLSMIKELVAIPSVTGGARESEPGEWLMARLKELPYFRENPRGLRLVDTPLEGSPHRLRSLVARVDAARETKRTILLIGHYDVVDTGCYGDIAEYAFDTEALGRIFGAGEDTLYGRGVMDMKCGAAIEAALIEEFAADREMFDVNLVMALVGDEENASAGMRGVLPVIDEMRREGLDFIAALNTEPGEAGKSGLVGPMVFLGTLGKLMPSFYIRGRDAHVGNCYNGYSALLAASRLVCLAEGNPHLADPLHGVCQPSWICLDMRALRESYSVTVPDRAYAYFNCFTTNNSPALVLEQMKGLAASALDESSRQIAESCRALTEIGYEGAQFVPPAPAVYTLDELKALARARRGEAFEAELKDFIENIPPGDMRARGLKVVDFIADCSGAEGPYIVCFFLSPWLPPRTDFTQDERDMRVVEAARRVKRLCAESCGLDMAEVELFAGLCDLSYVGGIVSEADVAALSCNTPGWGVIYDIPLREMQGLGLPVMNLGPSGEAPHKKDERLHLRYSLEILPELLKSAIREIAS